MSNDELYFAYDYWKGWTNPFTFSAEEAAYFAGETLGVKIANADVLEIGFGSGNFLAWARDQGGRISGTEINSRMLSSASLHNVRLLPRDFTTVANHYLEAFDTICAFDVFEHLDVDEVKSQLKACETMLRVGGHIILRFPNGQSPFGLLCQNGDPTHRSALSRRVIEQLVYGSRLETVRYAPAYRIKYGPLPTRIVRFLRYTARSMISMLLNGIYGEAIPWDPVVVLVMKKS
jgi:2-polyprenyl-3-methyl-5-hydroxy-6-metoxy-1,4-benzoquinol methylase